MRSPDDVMAEDAPRAVRPKLTEPEIFREIRKAVKADDLEKAEDLALDLTVTSTPHVALIVQSLLMTLKIERSARRARAS